MKEIRIHGRGGQGSVVLAELLGIAAFREGKYSLAFPFLGGGGERRGAPVQGFARIDSKPIAIRERIQYPDYVIVQDTSIMEVVDCYAGIKENGVLIVNTHDLNFICEREDLKVYTIDATKIALEALGRPIMNTVLLGAFAKITGEVSMEAVEETIRGRFDGELAEGNIKAARMAYDAVEA